MEKAVPVSSSMQPDFALFSAVVFSDNVIFQHQCLLTSQIPNMSHLLKLAIASTHRNHWWCNKSTYFHSNLFVYISNPSLQQLSDSTSYRSSGAASSTYDDSCRLSATGSSVSWRWSQAGRLLRSHTTAAKPTASTGHAAATTTAYPASTVTVPCWSASLKSTRYRSACWLPSVWYPCHDEHQFWKREHNPVSHPFVQLSWFCRRFLYDLNSYWRIWVM